MKKKKIAYLCVCLALGYGGGASAQEAAGQDLYTMSLEELMNIPIKSASKKDETLFDAPLSSYTITKTDIEKAGVTSIMEALRLAPGVIVREQANGIYDIHIRGFDNLLRYNPQPYTKSNLTTLVMIDNRPVFNHNTGGTFWESLPIDLHDVERIEIVRGPAAPLFGPNAVTGVINIITKRLTTTGLSTQGTVQYGGNGAMIANASAGTQLNDKFQISVSGNYQRRERQEEKYFYIPTQQYVSSSELNLKESYAQRYPQPELALNRWGANAFVQYKPTEKISFDLSAGAQEAESQKIFLGVPNVTFFTGNESRTQYINLAANVHALLVRTSFLNGFDNINRGSNPSKYDYQNIDIQAEYGLKLGEKYTITPGISYQNVTYSDLNYVPNPDQRTGFLNSSHSIQTLAGFLRTDLNFTDKWRVLASVRGDQFSTPDKFRASYELATTYKLNSKNLLRAAFTQSNSGSFIANSYLNSVFNAAPGTNQGFMVAQKGNPTMNLLTVRMYEVGYRAQFSKSLQFDIDVFHQRIDRLSAVVVNKLVVIPPSTILPSEFLYDEIPTQATQIGTTFSLNYIPNDKLQIKPFVTIQQTETKDLPAEYVSPKVNPALTYISGKHTNTPGIYGGYFINYKISPKFSVNLNGYYYSAHNQYNYSDKTGESEQGKINGKMLFNAKINYSVAPRINLFATGRNVLNDHSREFFGADRTGGLYLLGASFTMNP